MLIDENVEQDLKEYDAAKNMAEALNKWFPGHLWAVSVDLRGGVATVQNMALSGKYGFLIKLSEVLSDQRRLYMAAGEILERYRLSRGAMVESEMSELRRDQFGNVIGEIHA